MKIGKRGMIILAVVTVVVAAGLIYVTRSVTRYNSDVAQSVEVLTESLGELRDMAEQNNERATQVMADAIAAHLLQTTMDSDQNNQETLDSLAAPWSELEAAVRLQAHKTYCREVRNFLENNAIAQLVRSYLDMYPYYGLGVDFSVRPVYSMQLSRSYLSLKTVSPESKLFEKLRPGDLIISAAGVDFGTDGPDNFDEVIRMADLIKSTISAQTGKYDLVISHNSGISTLEAENTMIGEQLAVEYEKIGAQYQRMAEEFIPGLLAELAELEPLRDSGGQSVSWDQMMAVREILEKYYAPYRNFNIE